LAIGILMLVMKVYAYLITGSSAIYSDAAESVVHNVAVVFALFSIWYSSRPADRSHLYGHDKIAFFSAGFEGSLIMLAAGFIIFEAIRKWLQGLTIENLGAGIGFTVAATVINGALGAYLIWRGKRLNSLILEANGKHVLTDSWTSLGVIIGLVLTRLTGWLPFDPICAILVASNILWSGFDLMRRSCSGLMDAADPKMDEVIREVMTEETNRLGVQFHELRHRRAGNKTWIEVHLLFPDQTSLKNAHGQATEIEDAVMRRLGPGVQISTHLEPREDHARIHHDAPAA
jgi:cation diffusion facilitator family transporter